MTKALADYKALTFDCYGTLIDWESGIWDALQPLLMKNAGRDVPDRVAGLSAFARVEAAQQAETPGLLYPQVLERVHQQLSTEFGLETDASLDAAFGASVPHWPAFPDSADTLRRLARHFRLVILSNVNREGFAASNAKLGVKFDAIYTAEDIGSYKPDPRNFAHMLARMPEDLGIAAEDILHTAQSLRHDHVPAVAAGLATCWIDRQRLSEGGEWGATAPVPERPAVDHLFFTLADFADAVEAG